MKKLLISVVSLFVVLCFNASASAQDPQANDDSFTVHNAQTLETGANDIGNASPSTFVQPVHGTLYSYASPTRHFYRPNLGYTGPDSFQYRYCWRDQSGVDHCSTATVTIEVVNQPPVAVDDTFTIHAYGQVGPLVTGTGGDSDPDGDGLSFQLLSQPAYGRLEPTTVPDIKTYFVAVNHSDEPQTFTYRVCDNWGGCDTATVTLILNDLPPVAVSDFFIATGPYRIYLGVEGNDFSLDGDGFDIRVESVTGSTMTHGTFWGRGSSPDGEDGFLYTPFPGSYVGTDGFNYDLIEYYGLISNSARVTILHIPQDGAEDAGYSCPAVGQPVNVTNGNMWLQQRDYVLPGTGENIDITRFYNSMLQNEGLFGLGWYTKYDESLQFYGDDKMLRLNMPDGKAVYFGRATTSDPFISASPDVHGQIVQNQDSTYTLTFKDGRSHKFDSGGTLLWQKDRNGNQTTLTYNTSGFLTAITDSFGRILELTPNSNGMIAVAEDSTGTVATYEYYTGTNKLKTVNFPDGSKYKFEYTTIGGKTYLTTVKDALDNILETHAYDTQGRATTSSKDGGVEAFTFDYTNASQTNVTDARGNVSKYFFDTSRGKNLITRTEGVCGCGGGSEITTYDYDAHSNLFRKTDALSKVTTYKYDGNRNVIETSYQRMVGGSPDPITQKYTYNALGEVLTTTDAMGGVTTNTYDTHGNLLTTTDPLNHTTAYAYTSIGQLHTVTDALNHTAATITYDSQGRPDEVTDAANKTTDLAFDGRVRLTNVTNALNESTSFQYDLRNRLKKVIYPDSNFVSFNYDLAGRRTSITDERGNAATFAYDNAYRLTGITDALNHTTTFGYDAMSNLTSRADALGNTTDYRYDSFNRMDRITYPAPATGGTRLYEEFVYNAVGNITQKIDTAGRSTLYHYDDVHRVDYVTDAVNNVTRFEYNKRSQTTKVTDALNHEYTFTYDPLGRKLSQTRAGTTMSYEYDAVGNLAERTDHNGLETDYAYDALNRLTGVTYAGSSNFATYTYDDLSRITSAQNQNGTVTMGYNNRGWLNTTTDVHGHTVEYGFDEAGNRTSLELDNNTHTSYAYDQIGRLTTLTDESSNDFTFAYDNANRLIAKTLPNNVVTSYTYDGMSRLTNLKHENSSGTLFDNQYAYNSANQISQIADLMQTRNFAYDNVDRLTGVTAPGTSVENYGYDGIGNRTSSHLNSFFNYGNRSIASDIFDYQYDVNGNLTSRVHHQDLFGVIVPPDPKVYVWDEENRLVGLSSTVPGGAVTYEYDALGRRVKRAFDGGETAFIYDGMDVVMDDAGGNQMTYQNAPGIDNKLKLDTGNKSYYFLQDHLGSTIGLARNGGISYSTEYDSFGNPTNSSFPTRYQFTGRERDDFTGLLHYRARSYDPQIGRFISEDPIGFAGGDINLYGYVKNNPLMSGDPSGLNPDATLFPAMAGALGAAGTAPWWAPPVAAGAGFAAGYFIGYYPGQWSANHPSNPYVNGPINPFSIWNKFWEPTPYPAAPPRIPPPMGPGTSCQPMPRAIPLSRAPTIPFPDPDPDREGCAEEISGCVQMCSKAQFDPDRKKVWGGSMKACLKSCIPPRCLEGFIF